ncbi:beta-galactosidase [Microbacterium sp. SS28]|uniref:glycoside hydrolase family 35 protein n=1 Tax=Microbacterium sp. SS28 TaxID=2919948 RepID=UPI001FAAFD98|nr:beta-galactosidase [Microbacterium sp. SS28]
MPTFTIGETDFLLDGRPHRVIAGALHYFRVHPDQWADRIRKARLMGINTIETYVAWNAHEPRRGEWDATGWNDLGRFLDLVAAEGLHAIVRPGPYICAEWHNGGLPVWLTAMPGIGLRRAEPRYVAEVTRYLERVYEIVVPRQIDRGGNVVLVQIENEYGAYGSDKEYLAELVRVTREAGITVPLTTVDQPEPDMLRDGSLPELHKTGSFGSRATERLATLRAHQGTGPLMCSEFWDGWFDWWGGVHHTTDTAAAAAELDALLAAGASVNIYMFHGGTNFGLTNGANHKGRYLPITTSYDYDAPLDEAGNPTAKYDAFREVIARYAAVPDEVPSRAEPAPAFEVPLERVELAPAVRGEERHPSPPTFEALDHLGALVVYETQLPEGGDGRILELGAVRDHAWVFVDGCRIGALSRTRHEHTIALPAGERLTLVVEEQGRINYDGRLGEAKGLMGPVLLDGEPLGAWTATPVDLSAPTASPGLQSFRGSFELDAAHDLFLDTGDWGKGFAFVNGTLLGRYWRNGPQRTLFVPAPLTRPGENTLAVLELETLAARVARFVAEHELGPEGE